MITLIYIYLSKKTTILLTILVQSNYAQALSVVIIIFSIKSKNTAR